jgi:4-alpha-glucanotransferase
VGRPETAAVVDADLARLAAAYGVATEYEDFKQQPRTVPESTVRAVLAAMDVDVTTAEAVQRALEEAELRPWRRLVAPTVVVRARSAMSIPLRVPSGEPVDVTLMLESGGALPGRVRPTGAGRDVDGRHVGEAAVSFDDLPLGYHRLAVTAADRTDECHLIVAPQRAPWPAGADRVWGFLLQLYAVASRRSWGIGDLGDLTELAGWAGALGAGALLINPLHATSPVHPIHGSPYFPASKRFVNPIYLDVERVPEVAALDPAGRKRVAELATELRAQPAADGLPRIDRDAVWAAKLEALALAHAAPRSPERSAAYTGFCAREGRPLDDFATFCALGELHGRSWQDWPAELHDPCSAAVDRARAALADRIDLHRWLQFLCDEQLGAAQQAARDAGMPIGVIHDLAVGVDPGGSDGWALRGDLAIGVTVGAPPDLLAHQGQNWSQPPLRPDRLQETGFAAFRDMLRAVLRHAGGIRIDHVLGLFRLFWIPPGCTAADGTYVHYPADAMLGVLLLEAARVGAVVVGEDLGTVPPGVRDTLHDNGILGSAVVYFQRTDDWSEPLMLPEWHELSLATINTHDLPTAVGYLTEQRIDLYHQLGLLDEAQADRERRQERTEREQLVALMRAEGALAADVDPADPADLPALVDGMHALMARSPCRLVLAALWDVVLDPRQPNVPGTSDDVYPNWQLPLAEDTAGGPRPVLVDDLRSHPRVPSVVAALRDGAPHRAGVNRPTEEQRRQ